MCNAPCHIDYMVTTLFPAFLLTALLIELTPGPNMAWLVVTSASEGKRSGLAAVAGIATGLAMLGLVSAFGLAQLAAASPLLYSLLRYAGVAYLLWLAWTTWRSSDKSTSEAAKTSMQLLAWFRHGLLLNLLNPKAAVFFITVIPAYTASDSAVMPQTLLLSTSYVAIATAIHLALVLMAAQAYGLLATERRERTVKRVFAVMLAGIAIWFLVSTR